MMFPKDLEDSRQVKILKKTTTLLNLHDTAAKYDHINIADLRKLEKMTEVSVETCFVNLRVLSFSLKF